MRLLASASETDPTALLPSLLAVVAGALSCDAGALYVAEREGQEPVLVAELGAPIPRDDASVVRVALPTKVEASMLLKRGGQFSAEELRTIDMLAALVGVRIENARLHAEAQRRIQHVSLLLEMARAGAEARDSSSIIERAIASLSKGFGSDLATVRLLEDERLVLRGYTGAAAVFSESLAVDDRTLVGRAAQQRKTVVIHIDEWPEGSLEKARRLGIRHGAATPLLAGERLIGAVGLVRTHGPTFSRDDVEMLESCAAQLSAVLEHARVFEAEQRRARDLTVINEVGALISHHLDLSAILSIGVRQLTRIGDVARTELLLLEPDREVLRLVAASPEEEGIPNLVLPIRGNSVAQLALERGKPVWTTDAMNDPRASNELAKRRGYHTILAVPLITDGKAIGAIALCDKRKDRRFSSAEIETAVALANQLASALANARLFEDLRRSYEKLAKTQEQLIGQERLAALGELAAVMAHEVRNPLAIIFNAVASLKKLDQGNAGDTHTLLDIVAEEAGQLNRIVGDLLDFARPHNPTFRLESLEDLVWAALESAKGAEVTCGIEFAVDVSKSLPRVFIDARLVKQALINLLTNAIQALPSGGRIEIRAAAQNDNMIEVSVIDNGPGIAREIGGRVLQPFFTTKATGTGLGLAIVKRIAETHGGDLVLASTPGGGTTTTLRFPLRPASAPPARAV